MLYMLVTTDAANVIAVLGVAWRVGHKSLLSQSLSQILFLADEANAIE